LIKTLSIAAISQPEKAEIHALFARPANTCAWKVFTPMIDERLCLSASMATSAKRLSQGPSFAPLAPIYGASKPLESGLSSVVSVERSSGIGSPGMGVKHRQSSLTCCITAKTSRVDRSHVQKRMLTMNEFDSYDTEFTEAIGEIEAETDDAVLFRPSGEKFKFWIPKSLIESRDKTGDGEDWIEIPQWLADREGV